MKALHLSSSKYIQLLLNMPVFAAFPGAFAKYVVDGSKKATRGSSDGGKKG